MLPWRHSQAWRALTCWFCLFVKIERLDDEEARVPAGSNRQRMAAPSRVPAKTSLGGYKIVHDLR
jgi:hypothetical protein